MTTRPEPSAASRRGSLLSAADELDDLHFGAGTQNGLGPVGLLEDAAIELDRYPGRVEFQLVE
jgi:hypothetical protein